MNQRRVLVAAVAVVTILAMLASGVAVLVWALGDDPLPEPTFRTDRAALGETLGRLAVVERRLRELPTPPGAVDHAVRTNACGTDSGDLFQPSVHRLWGVPPTDADRVVADIGTALRSQGWAVPEAPDRFGRYEVAMEEGGWRAVGVLNTSFERTEAYVEAYVAGARPCELVSE